MKNNFNFIILLYLYKMMNNKIKVYKNKQYTSDSDKDENDILDKILSISSNILNKINILENKINCIETKIQNIEENIEFKKKNNELSSHNLKELKKENLIMNKEDILKALSYRDFRSVLYIFKNIYKNKQNSECAYPIKIAGKRSYEYYHNSKWNPDLYGYHCTNILCLNIQNLFIKHNNMEDLNYNDFIINQEFITKLSDEKYQKNIFKNIIEEVRINNL